MKAMLEFIEGLKVFGQEASFWVTVSVGLALKALLSPKTPRQKFFAGAIAGVVTAYYSTDFVIKKIDSLTPEDRDMVVIALVLTGEHFVRWIVQLTPEKAFQFLRPPKKGA